MIAVLIFFILVFIFAFSASKKPSVTKKTYIYNYKAKASVMTHDETEFFHMLNNAVGDKFYIFPQVHLSSIIDHKVNGQNWDHAFSHINSKSVDYVLCDKVALKPIFAVELDDYTHQYNSRIERDKEVARMLESAGVPLVRFTDYKSLSHEDISARFIMS